MKVVGSSLYIHKSALDELMTKMKNEDIVRLNNYINELNDEKFSFEIIKYDKKTQNISFIESNDWDIKHEPSVGNAWCYHIDGRRKFIKSSNKIYHCKYMFVKEDYVGFDVEKSKERAKLWNSIPNIKEHKSKIGNKKYWEKLCDEYKIPL